MIAGHQDDRDALLAQAGHLGFEEEAGVAVAPGARLQPVEEEADTRVDHCRAGDLDALPRQLGCEDPVGRRDARGSGGCEVHFCLAPRPPEPRAPRRRPLHPGSNLPCERRELPPEKAGHLVQVGHVLGPPVLAGPLPNDEELLHLPGAADLVAMGDRPRGWIEARYPDATWHTEVPVAAPRTDGGQWNGVIDLLLRLPSGEEVVMDQKSSLIRAEQCAAKAASFTGQLHAHGEALVAQGLTVRVMWIHFPMAPVLANVT